MVAWAGGDPGQVHVPRLKHRLQISIRRVGDTRFLTIGPTRRKWSARNEATAAQSDSTRSAVVLRGVVLRDPESASIWLAMKGAGVMPIRGITPTIDRKLRDLNQRWVTIRGALSSTGIAVEMVQPAANTSQADDASG